MALFNRADVFNLLSKLTFRRCWNGLKVLASYYGSQWLHRPIQWGMPISVSFEPTTSCNLRCPECPSGLRAFTRDTGMLDPVFFRQTIDQLYKDLYYLVFYFQGEPYLHPQFSEMVRYAVDKKIYTATSTNAHFLHSDNAKKTVESGLDRLLISIDGTTQEVYEQYRVGGHLAKVLEGTKNIIHWKKVLKSKTPLVVFQFLVVKPNEHQTEKVKKLAAEMEVDEVWFKTAQINDYENDPHQLIPTIDKFSRYTQTPGGTIFKGNRSNHCWRLWHDPVITWDGNVVPCCFDKDATHRMGNLKKQSFASIWRSEPYRQFRAQILKGRSQISICANCSEGTRVWGN